MSQRLTAPLTAGGSQQWITSYAYDQVNRIVSGQEQVNATTPWTLTYGYADAMGQNGQYGNLRVTDPNGLLPSGLSCGSYDAGTNRCADAGFQYDSGAANGPGNLTAIQGRAMTYDAENRQTSLTDGSASQYFYDGEGRRVGKIAGGQTTVYVYDAAGQLAAEYDPSAGDQGGCARCYLTVDHLGSARMVTDATGAVIRRYDYAPFGGEINSSYGQRTLVTGYVMSDGVTPKFTGKMRDYESSLGLDYFGARYFSSAQGRFTTPDEPLTFAEPGNPQTWNLYGYGLNNPLLYSDSDGHEPCVNGVNPENGNICTTVTAHPDDPWAPGGSLFSLWWGRMMLDAAAAVSNAASGAQVVQTVVDLASRSNPTCVAGYAGVGASIGSWAGGGLGALGLAGGPAVAATVPGGAAGGAALGGGTGGLGGMIMCSSGTWGGSGGGRGGDYREKTRGANRSDAQKVADTAREVGVDRRAFGRFIERVKGQTSRGASQNFEYDELLQLAREFKAGAR